MTDRKKIVCYDDNPDYGGHQIMACLAVEGLAKSAAWQPTFFCSPTNIRLNKRLKEIQTGTGNLEICETPFTTRKLQGLRNRFAVKTIGALRERLEAKNPDVLLCVQGEIEDGSLALCAAEKMAAPCISYIPVPHRMALMGAKLGAVRDMLNAYLFKKPDGWITISGSMKALLEERGATAPIEVVHNGINMKRFTPRDKTAARAALGLPLEKTILGTIGRIEFNQKQQTFLVRTFFDHFQNSPSMHLVIIGDGPDRGRLEALIGELGLHKQVTLLPWQSDSSIVYSALDLLIIPSRFEGVPLVMLEALACGTPVIGSARDGMKDLLPASWTFEHGNSTALADVIKYVVKDWKEELPALQTRVRNEYTVEKFQQNFEAALNHFLIMGRRCT
ncbi:MAG: glycosyltransferase family 4 protein [Kiritimatiellaceae bacterium]|nr:glycosyltransferase family 4 protein [Kiritimatiellaceae bacterium]